jgi:hypothetical protein
MAIERTPYAEVALASSLVDQLSAAERAMLPLLIDACREIDAIFWQEAYGDREALLDAIADPDERRFAEINYGPWDRLRGNRPFVAGAGPKPAGANFYPSDMSTAEFEAACADSPERAIALKSEYTLIRRDGAGRLIAVPYHEAFADRVGRAAGHLREAAAIADDPGLREYLQRRADALLTDDYRPSDVAWLDMKSNGVDVIIGPIETYEDALYGRKTAHGGMVLLKDRAWSGRISKYAHFLPGLQRGLPVCDAYKQESPGSASDLLVYDVVFEAGDANTPLNPAAVNLPNDEEVTLAKGSRRLQLRNVMRAKFERIVQPTADLLLAPDQRKHVRFDSTFEAIMFHEIAHGLGIKHTTDGLRTVQDALADQANVVEETKADVLGAHMVASLIESGELEGAELTDIYVSYVADMFRMIGLGSASSNGRSNIIQLGVFERMGAVTRDPSDGTYRVNVPRMREAFEALAQTVLRFQGDGDYQAALAFFPKEPEISSALRADLDRLESAGIPRTVMFEPTIGVVAEASA